MIETYNPTPLPDYREYPEEEMRQRADAFYAEIKRRHSVRHFSDRPVPRDIIERCLLAAGTAPSGANHQPWHFVCVSDSGIKQRIRGAAEIEENGFYGGRAGQEWLDDLQKIGTDAHKPFLEHAPWLIAIFAQRNGETEEGDRRKNYYVPESVGIATGFLINALHHSGLATLTHTPKPMKFLNEILERPDSERPYILLVVGYPAEGAEVPAHALEKKSLEELSTFV
ncbi:nitroreductase family protein [Aestuariispira insulae]|uniref:Nitroreductase n=1 Tax=Aestuariispira insulae TaxID=1461337 RepID=A0A3D9HWF8_9PROT|nr:nitroreductase family protein [Aestuariispira insulae]RED53807.1 nitroreductase [Aestuariispira insulae]